MESIPRMTAVQNIPKKLVFANFENIWKEELSKGKKNGIRKYSGGKHKNCVKTNVVTIYDLILQWIFLCNSNSTNIVYVNVTYLEITNI